METIQLQDLCDKLISVAKEAGCFIRGELERVTSAHIEVKEKHSLVTYVDKETEKMIVSQLKEIFPSAAFLTEEGTTEQLSGKEYTWVIDPLDGTTNFLQHIPVFCVSIALVRNGQPILGAIYDPMQNECFYGWKGGGAWMNGKRIQVSSTPLLSDAVVATGFPYARKNIDSLIVLLKLVLEEARGLRRLGSAALDLAYTACGRFDGYYEAMINPWDVAAGILLVEEAGGVVTDMDGLADPLYSQHIVGGNSVIHEILLNHSKAVNPHHT
ncbi:MAG: inositol monophosphatase [Saprospiraceae bacterium]|nr:inositol monophosphatase [Candidatus Vicinibacter affinis]